MTHFENKWLNNRKNKALEVGGEQIGFFSQIKMSTFFLEYFFGVKNEYQNHFF